MKKTKNLLTLYGKLVSRYPGAILVVMFLLTLASLFSMSTLRMEAMDTADMLPESHPEISSLNYVKDEFGSIESGIVVLEIDPEELSSAANGSARSRDVRDPEYVRYANVLAQKIELVEGVSSAKSIADVIKLSNDGRIPESEKTIKSILANSTQAANYINPDYSISLVRLGFTGEVGDDVLVYEITKIIDETPRPAGISAKITGSFGVSYAIQQQVGPDMARTSVISLLGILLIVYMIYRSLRYSLTSLLAILLGNVWSFGFIAAIGMSLTSATSGAASMIMGIGIDFGIQVVSRFRQELARRDLEVAMNKTVEGVTVPMLTTTLATLIGFRAMTLGELSIMGDLGTMMSYGVIGCMLAALTVVPAVLVLIEKRRISKQSKV